MKKANWKELLERIRDIRSSEKVIYERADASKPFMGLKRFSGDFPALKDIGIAKNYLNGEENSLPNGTMDKTIALLTKADINTIENAERWSLC